VGDCGVGWHCSATLKDISARTPRGEATLNPQTFNAFRHVTNRALAPGLHGFRSRYIGETSKDVLRFQASISPAEAARSLTEHLASRIARVTLPKRSVPVPSSLVVVQASIIDALFFSCCNVLTQHSGHLQTLYAVLGNFSAVDPVPYDRQVLSHYYYTNRPLIFTFAGGYSNLKMAGPCQAICFNLQDFRLLLQQRRRFHTACFGPNPPG
jgi:hypothetical protein